MYIYIYIRAWSTRRGFKRNFYKLPRPWSLWESSPASENSHGRTRNWTQDLMCSSQKFRPPSHETGHNYISKHKNMMASLYIINTLVCVTVSHQLPWLPVSMVITYLFVLDYFTVYFTLFHFPYCIVFHLKKTHLNVNFENSLDQRFPTRVPRYHGVPQTLPRVTARCRNKNK
jgi:hypothetical protein